MIAETGMGCLNTDGRHRATDVRNGSAMRQIELRLWEKLKEVIDPGANLNVVDMGLIRELSISDDNTVSVTFRPSSPVCPLAFALAANIKEALEEVKEVSCVHLRIVDFARANELNTMIEG